MIVSGRKTLHRNLERVGPHIMSKNKELIGEVAETLLTKIKASAEQTEVAAKLLELAQAFALVAEHDPRAAKRSSGPSRIR